MKLIFLLRPTEPPIPNGNKDCKTDEPQHGHHQAVCAREKRQSPNDGRIGSRESNPKYCGGAVHMENPLQWPDGLAIQVDMPLMPIGYGHRQNNQAANPRADGTHAQPPLV